MNFINNPFNILIDIIEENYPNIDCDIYIGNQETDGVTIFGCTIFPDDETEKIIIELHYSLSLNDATEVFAHELAHVIAGKEAGHTQEWKKVFDDLTDKFQDKLNEIFIK